MSRLQRMRRPLRGDTDINITAFLNLMVILVPFLLITAVFSHMTILELNLPPNQQSPDNPDQKKERNFELIIRSNEIVVSDTLGGPIQSFRKVGGKYDMKAVTDLLMKIKAQFPEKQNITILLEPKIPYEVLVEAMDASRVVDVVEAGSVVQKELFPVISIGDAPS
ncbi:MAG: biopolymer transporter ExbD [Gammaproteobacteria bacterium]